MPTAEAKTTERRWTATELRRLPREQREAIMAAAADRAIDEYTHNADLTAFEAYGEDDLYGHSSGPATR